MTIGGYLSPSFEDLLDLGGAAEGVHALAAGADLADGLRAAQHEDGQHGLHRRGERVAQADLVFPLGDAGAGLVALADEAALGEAVEGGEHGGLGEAHHRLAAGELVAAADQRIDRQG
jgi:hypothetical protein